MNKKIYCIHSRWELYHLAITTINGVYELEKVMLLTQTIESVMQIQCGHYWNSNIIQRRKKILKFLGTCKYK